MAQRRVAAQEKRRASIYGLAPELHAALLEFQGGACAICQKARGVRRALAVDHDHALAREHDHDEDKGCVLCLRGLLCKRCNRILGDFRDDPEQFDRAASYLRQPPWRRVWATASAPSASADAGSTSASPGSSASDASAWDSFDERT